MVQLVVDTMPVNKMLVNKMLVSKIRALGSFGPVSSADMRASIFIRCRQDQLEEKLEAK